MRWIVFIVLFLSALLAPCSAQAATEVKVLETWPVATDATLARNQNFYLRLAYRTDAPVSIWARPYFHGEPANAGSNPSLSYNGSGEALGWFFFMQPGDQVDEIRISAGDGRTATTPEVARLPVHLTGGTEAGAEAAEPQWVTTLRQSAELAQRKAYEERMNTPVSTGDAALFSGFMLAALGLGLAGILLPLWAVWRWRSGWRVAAAVPALIMAFVVLRIVAGVSRDPTSHNLWPFEVLQTGVLTTLIMLGLLLARRVIGGRAVA